MSEITIENSGKLTDEQVPRILQAQAQALEKEIASLGYGILKECETYLTPERLSAFNNEGKFMLKTMLFITPLIKKNASFGQQLLNLKYAKAFSLPSLLAYFSLNALLPYIRVKFEKNTAMQDQKIGKIFLTFFKLVDILNTLVFIKTGKYPKLPDRILQLKYAHEKPNNRAQVSYDFMRKELFLQELKECVMNVVPTINVNMVKRRIWGVFRKSKDTNSKKPIIMSVINRKCVICNEFPISPCLISIVCPHVACYYCIKSNVMADEKFVCPACDEVNTVSEELQFLCGN